MIVGFSHNKEFHAIPSRHCQQCFDSRDTDGVVVVIPNSLWLSIAKMEEVICHHCIEERIGRPLEETDFPDMLTPVYATQLINVRTIPVNHYFFMMKGWPHLITEEEAT